MSTDKEMLKALYKIAVNQQKIISKLAQAQGLDINDPQAGGATASWDNVEVAANLALKHVAKEAGVDESKYSIVPYNVSSYGTTGAMVYNSKSPVKGLLEYKVMYEDDNQKKMNMVKDLFKSYLMGESLKTNDGKNSEVINDVKGLWIKKTK